jgi:hypothetical protein
LSCTSRRNQESKVHQKSEPIVFSEKIIAVYTRHKDETMFIMGDTYRTIKGQPDEKAKFGLDFRLGEYVDDKGTVIDLTDNAKEINYISSDFVAEQVKKCAKEVKKDESGSADVVKKDESGGEEWSDPLAKDKRHLMWGKRRRIMVMNRVSFHRWMMIVGVVQSLIRV